RNAVNPLTTRGTEALRGLGAQGSRTGRTNVPLFRGSTFGSAGRFGFGTTRFGSRSSRSSRPQYIARLNLPTAPRSARASTTSNGLGRADDRIRKAVASLPGAKQVQVQLADGDVVVLRGAVATERQRRLAELMAKLQPGVKHVKNELRVESPNEKKPTSTR
ncbi:MAG TPA: BON domain-containing protein, partial [Planctomycetaceae bacterium]|nr:BON domain-containing protein [Planctomycetaceae bacterium]